MLLSQLPNSSGITVLRDTAIENLGFVFERRSTMLTFIENSRYLEELGRNTEVAAVLTTSELAPRIPAHLGAAVSTNPRLDFARLHNGLCESGFYWEDFPTVIDAGADVHPTAFIPDKNVRIGKNTVVGPHATILERCMVGEQCVVGAGAVLGGVGMQTVRTSAGLLEMRHAGGLVLADGAHILPGAVIATGLFRHNTEIGASARIGSQAFISHGVRVGQCTFIGHGAVINGNVAVGDNVWLGPGAIVSQMLTIGESAVVSLGAVVIRNVEAGARVSGNFAMPHRALLRSMAAAGSRG